MFFFQCTQLRYISYICSCTYSSIGTKLKDITWKKFNWILDTWKAGRTTVTLLNFLCITRTNKQLSHHEHIVGATEITRPSLSGRRSSTEKPTSLERSAWYAYLLHVQSVSFFFNRGKTHRISFLYNDTCMRMRDNFRGIVRNGYNMLASTLHESIVS